MWASPRPRLPRTCGRQMTMELGQERCEGGEFRVEAEALSCVLRGMDRWSDVLWVLRGLSPVTGQSPESSTRLVKCASIQASPDISSELPPLPCDLLLLLNGELAEFPRQAQGRRPLFVVSHHILRGLTEAESPSSFGNDSKLLPSCAFRLFGSSVICRGSGEDTCADLLPML